MTLKSLQEIEAMRAAGRAVSNALAAMAQAIVAGETTTLSLDEVARESLTRDGAKPSLLGYRPPFSRVPYQHATCISVNDEVIHGVPGRRVLQDGDIVGLDLDASVDGWMADGAVTVAVGKVELAARNLMAVTRDATLAAISQARVGNRVGDISSAMQRHAERHRCNVVRTLSGHGIGRRPHEDPDVPCFGRPATGARLVPGMVICIEAMVTAGGPDVEHAPGDLWTIKTSDGSLSAHFEHTVAITENGSDLLTSWPSIAR